MNAYLILRPVPALRHDAFAAGLRALGYAVHATLPARAARGDLIVLWNGMWTGRDPALRRLLAQGARLLVAENGYIGREPGGQQYFALAEGGHNGSGRWRVGAEDRWAGLGIELKPWRVRGDHIVVCGQRGFGSPTMASPPQWHLRMAAQLRARTKRPVIVREHGGKPGFHPATTEDMQRLLVDAHAVVIWSSSNGVRALVEGVPVIYQALHWICADAATRDLARIESPPLPERLPALQRLAWAMWRADEIASGEAYRAVLGEVRAAA